MNQVDRLLSFVGSRPKTYSYLIDHYTEEKKAEGTKKCVIKQRFKL